MLRYLTLRDPVRSLRSTTIVVGAAALTTLLLIISGIPLVGHDTYFHINNLAQFHAAQENGIIFPRWTHSAYYGLGSPVFYFYPPLFSFIASAVAFVIPSFAWSIRATSVMIFIGMLVTSADYFRAIGSAPRVQWLAAVAYAASPYAFFDNVVRGCYSEFLAMVFVPFALSGIELISMRNESEEDYSIAGFLRIAAAIALILLSSIPVAALCSIALPIYALIRVRGLRASITAIAASILGLSCAAFYLLPMLDLRDLVHLDHVIAFDNNIHFRESVIPQILSRDVNTGNLTDLILVLVGAALIAAWFARWKQDRDPLSIAWIVILFIVELLHVPTIATPLANNLPIVSIIQFPSRAHIFTVLSAVSLLATTHDLSVVPLPFGILKLCACWTVVIAAIFLGLHPGGTWVETPVHQQQVESAYEYAPATITGARADVQRIAKSRANDPSVKILDELKPHESVKTNGENTTNMRLNASLRTTHFVRLHTFFWPFLQLVTSGGESLKIFSDEEGFACAVLPPGNYSAELSLSRSPLERAGVTISLAGLFGIVIISGVSVVEFARRRKRIGNKNPTLIRKWVWSSQDKETLVEVTSS